MTLKSTIPSDDHPVRFLASVVSTEEAHIAAAIGADLIDGKDPSKGALGALPTETIAAIRASVPANIDVSATIGDVAFDADIVCNAAEEMAFAGANIVKIGLFPGRDAPAETLTKLAPLAQRIKLVLVMLADDVVDLEIIRAAKEVGFLGVMLDTRRKDGRTLTDFVTTDRLQAFVDQARAANLWCGLAGALRKDHVPQLLALRPDVLGFRSALCSQKQRTCGLDRDAVLAIRQIIPYSSTPNTKAELEFTE